MQNLPDTVAYAAVGIGAFALGWLCRGLYNSGFHSRTLQKDIPGATSPEGLFKLPVDGAVDSLSNAKGSSSGNNGHRSYVSGRTDGHGDGVSAVDVTSAGRSETGENRLADSGESGESSRQIAQGGNESLRQNEGNGVVSALADPSDASGSVVGDDGSNAGVDNGDEAAPSLPTGPKPYLTKAEKQLVRDVREIILANIQVEDLSVAFIAGKLFMSTSTLYRKFRAMLGISTVEYVRHIRIWEALVLMDAGQLSLSDIAFRVGYSSLPSFSRAFRNELGISPAQFKRTDIGEVLARFEKENPCSEPGEEA